MANDVGALYVRLGLSLSELETGFVAASQTVAANISRLNREAELVKIRAQVEMEGLDAVADAEKILQIRQEALNKQMAIQRDRVRILDAELQELSQTQGINAISTQRATIRIERERLALARLESEVREVTASISELNSTDIDVSGSASISGGAGSGGSSGGGGSGGGGGGSDWADLIPFELPTTKVAAFGMAIGALGAAVSKTTDIFTEALEGFRETEKQSYELNLDFNGTEQFLREVRLGGGDIGDFEGFIRGITDAYVKGEYDDPEFIALRRYGAEITDATGRLKDFKDLTEEVYQAFKEADAEGSGIEFLQMVGGEAGVRDAIQLFSRLEEAREDAEKIYDANLEPEQWHKIERALNLATMQSEEFSDAIATVFAPAAQAAAENFFKIFQTGTEWIVENKDAIQSLGFVVKETFATIGDGIKDVWQAAGDKISDVNKLISGKTGDSRVDKVLGDMSWRYGGAKQAYGVDAMISGQIDDTAKSFGAMNGIIEQAKQHQAEFNGSLEEAGTLAEAICKPIFSAADLAKKMATGDPLSQYGWQRLERFKDEIEDLKIEIEFGDDDYQKSLAQLDLQENRELHDKLQVSMSERLAIEEAFALKRELIEKEHAEEIAKAQEEVAQRIAEYWKNVADLEYEMTHTAFEKQIRDIEIWKDAQQEKAETAEEVQAIIAESAAKEAQAFEREMDRIKGKLQSLDDKIFEQEHSQYENDLRKLQQERIKYYEDYFKSGILNAETQAMIERYYQNALGKLQQRAAESQANGGDYTKSAEGTMNRVGNGIMVIEGDQIVDDGLIQRQREIGLMANENQIRAQLLKNLDEEARSAVGRLESANNWTAIQQELMGSVNQVSNGGGFEIIEGDQVVSRPQLPQPSVSGYQVIEGDQIVAMPTEQLQQFGAALDLQTQQLAQFGEATAMPPILDIAQLQTPQTIPTTTETVLTPLNNIAEIASNILTAIENRQPAQVNVSPSISNNLGGAYVFDNAMRKSLVDDITSRIVDEITNAVKQATSQANFSYGA